MTRESLRPRRLPSRLLFVADSEHAPDGLPDLVRRAVRAGVRFLEIRRSGEGRCNPRTAEQVDEVRRCLAVAGPATVLVNDRVDVALLAGAAGTHVGQSDLPAKEARSLLGDERWLGLSTHDREQLDVAQELPLDYVAVGPIFESPTKSGHAEPVGLDHLAAWCGRSRLPVVAIGGITVERAPAVLAAGAAAVAVASGIARGDVAGKVARFLDAVGERAAAREHWCLTGFSGAGKSTVGRALARRAGRTFLDLDDVLAERHGRPVPDLLRERGEPVFRELESKALATLLCSAEPHVLALGGGSLDHQGSRDVVREHAVLTWLDVPLETCLERLGRDRLERPVLERARREGGTGAVEALYRERCRAYRAADVRVDAAGPPDQVAAALFELLVPGGSDAGARGP